MASTIEKEFLEEEEHAAKTMGTWRLISLFVAIPGCFVCAYSAWTKEQAHIQHVAEHGRDPFVPYTHLRLRNKPYPWGDGNHSLFHNPHTNALPEGYEDE
jgi:cytochrome c oxidase subunit 6a